MHHKGILIDGETVATVGPGECVGEMALLDKEPRSATVIARSPMKLLARALEFIDPLDGRRRRFESRRSL